MRSPAKSVSGEWPTNGEAIRYGRACFQGDTITALRSLGFATKEIRPTQSRDRGTQGPMHTPVVAGQVLGQPLVTCKP